MKYLRSLLCLAVVTLVLTSSLARADDDDSVRLLVYPTNGDTATVVIGSKTCHVPIAFEVGLSWEDVKDAYHIPPAYATMLEAGRVSIFINCAGASFTAHQRLVH